MIKRNIYAIITAAGSGTRFKPKGKPRTMPKQFVKLNGKPVILYSLLKFQENKNIKNIIVSAGVEYFDLIHSIASANKISKLKALVEGGKTRFQSVKNAFNSLYCNPDDIVIIHDAARPNFSSVDLKNLAEHSLNSGEVILGNRASETVKTVKNEVVKSTVPRDNLWLVQTPQAFRYKVLQKSYKAAGRKTNFTDESSLAEFAGYKVRIIEGFKYNIKITGTDDLEALKRLMK